MERWHESEVGNGKRQVGLLWGPAFRCCHPATVVLYIHFGEERGGTKALAQQRAELLGEAGGRRQSCWNLPHLPVVQERHRGAVALVPVVSVQVCGSSQELPCWAWWIAPPSSISMGSQFLQLEEMENRTSVRS